MIWVEGARVATGDSRSEDEPEELEAVLLRLQAAMNETPEDVPRILSAFLDAARRVAGAVSAVFEECRNDELRVAACSGEPIVEVGSRRRISGTLQDPGLCGGDRRVGALAVDGPAVRELIPHAPSRKIGRLRHALIVPLAYVDRPLGVLTLLGRGRLVSPTSKPLEIVRAMLCQWLGCRVQVATEDRRRHLLVDALPVLVSYVDREQRYQENNAAYGRWFGVDVATLRGRHLRDVLGADAYEAIRPKVDAALGGEHVVFEATIPYRDAGTRRVRADYVPDTAPDGTIQGFFALITDLEDQYQAESDFLTGTLSRRKLMEELDRHLVAATRYRRPLSIALLDFDHFKSINDRFGHLAGDSVLQQGGDLFRSCLRSPDLVGRWGGEEFLLITPESHLEAARVVAERIRRTVAEHEFSLEAQVTLSAGLATLLPGDTRELLLDRADRALYDAKDSGRNCVRPVAEPRIDVGAAAVAGEPDGVT